jgi:hypothetical protein
VITSLLDGAAVQAGDGEWLAERIFVRYLPHSNRSLRLSLDDNGVALHHPPRNNNDLLRLTEGRCYTQPTIYPSLLQIHDLPNVR